MTETTMPPGIVGTGKTEADAMTFRTRPVAADPVAASISSLADDANGYAAAFRTAADLSANLPQNLRQLVSEASTAITAPLGIAAQARIKADGFRADRTMYPEGREILASETIKAASDKVAESFGSAEVRLKVAEASLYEAARPRISPDAAMPARADLTMLTQRHLGNPGTLTGALKNLAQRGDSVGALVADSTYLGDFLDANGIDAQTREAILTSVRAEVVKTAAESGDPKRSAAGRTSLALAELRKARVAAASYTRHTLNGK